jgi:hypothetical protein
VSSRHLRLLPILLAAIGLLAWPKPALACTCGLQYGPQGSFAQADAVFAATVMGITDLSWVTSLNPVGMFPAQLHPLLYRRATMAVEQSWKGVSSTEVALRTCGIDFAVGGQYLVYAYQGRQSLETDPCTRTQLLADARADMAYLQTRPQIRLSSPPPLALLVTAGIVLMAVGLAAGAVIWRHGSRPRRFTHPD